MVGLQLLVSTCIRVVHSFEHTQPQLGSSSILHGNPHNELA